MVATNLTIQKQVVVNLKLNFTYTNIQTKEEIQNGSTRWCPQSQEDLGSSSAWIPTGYVTLG